MTRSLVNERPAWMLAAACRNEPKDTFYPQKKKGYDSMYQYGRARLICATCPVRDECLEWALDTPETIGFWGGHTPMERRHLRVEQGRPLPGRPRKWAS